MSSSTAVAVAALALTTLSLAPAAAAPAVAPPVASDAPLAAPPTATADRAAPSAASTSPGAAAGSALRADAELDPTAYALAGNSIHVGLGYGRFRLDLGNYALAIPRWVHGNDGFDVSFEGYGAKLQVFPFAEQRGLFVGIDGGLSRVLIRREGTELAVRQRQLAVGAHVGYRLFVVDRLYVTPWIGVGYQFGADDVTLGGAAYRGTAISVFPAIHVGYQLR